MGRQRLRGRRRRRQCRHCRRSLGSDGADGCALSDRRQLSQTPVAGRVLGRWDLFRANVTEVVLIKDNNI